MLKCKKRTKFYSAELTVSSLKKRANNPNTTRRLHLPITPKYKIFANLAKIHFYDEKFNITRLIEDTFLFSFKVKSFYSLSLSLSKTQTISLIWRILF